MVIQMSSESGDIDYEREQEIRKKINKVNPKYRHEILAPPVELKLEQTTKRGRPVSKDTKLGRLISERNLNASRVAVFANITPRYMTEYMAGRKQFRPQDILALCRVLQVNPDAIIEDIDDEYEDEVTQLTDSNTSVGGIHTTKTVEDLQRQRRIERSE